MDKPAKKRKLSGARRRAIRRAAERAAREQTAAGQTTAQTPGREPQLNAGPQTGPELPQPDLDGRTPVQGREGGNSPEGRNGSAQSEPGPQTAMFERPGEMRADANLARRALRHDWQPPAETTKALMAKGTRMAMASAATLSQVIGMTKLHLDAHRQAANDDHHEDRMDFANRSLSLRRPAGIVSTGVDGMPRGGTLAQIESTGAARITIFLPDNGRDTPNELDQIEATDRE